MINENSSVIDNDEKVLVSYSPISTDDDEEKEEKKTEIIAINEEPVEEKVFSSSDDDEEEKKNQAINYDNELQGYGNYNNSNYGNYCMNNMNGMEIEYDNGEIEESNNFLTKNRIDVIADVLYNEIKNTYIPYTYYRPISFEYSISYIYSLLKNSIYFIFIFL